MSPPASSVRLAVASLILVACGAAPPRPGGGGAIARPPAAAPAIAYAEPPACAGSAPEPPAAAQERPHLVLQERTPSFPRAVAVSAAEGLLATVDFFGEVRVYDVERAALLWVRRPNYGESIPTALVWDGPRTLGMIAGRDIAFVDPLGRPVTHDTQASGIVRTAAGPRLRTLVRQVIADRAAQFVDGAGKRWSLVPPSELASSGLYEFDVFDAQAAVDDSCVAIVPRAANDTVVVHRPLDAPGRVVARGVHGFSLAPRGDFLVTQVRGDPTIIDTTTGAARSLETDPDDGTGGTLVVSSDGATVYGYDTRGLRAWSAATGKRLWGRPIEGEPTHLVTIDQGRAITIGNTLSVYDGATGRLRRQIAPSKSTRADWLAFDGKGGLFVSGSGRVDGWALDRAARATSADMPGAREVAASAGGELLATRVTGRPCGGQGTEVEFVHLGGAAPAERACVPVATLESSVSVDAGFTIDPVSRRALDQDKQQIVDLATAQVTKLEPSKRSIPTGGLTWAGDRVFGQAYTDAGGFGGWLEVWDARTGKRLYELGVNPDEASWSISATVSGDGKTLVVGKNKTLATFDAASGTERARTALPADVRDVAFLGDDVVVLDMDGALARVRGGKVALRGEPLHASQGALHIEPGGRRAAASGATGVVVWDLATLAPAATLTSFEDAEWVAFTPGGAYGGTAEVADRVAFVYDDPPEAFSFEQFAAAYRKPEIVQRRLRGERVDGPPMVRPPEIALVSPPRVEGAVARLEVEVKAPSRVDAVRVFADGRPLAAQAVCAAAGRATLSVPLLPGRNRLAAIAYDARGVASNPAVADVVAPPDPSRRPTLWIASVGISHYPKLGAANQLELADDDARGVADLLAKTAGPDARYAQADVQLLLNEDATRARVLAAMDRLAEMGPDDVAVVFFAGHGARPSADEDTRVLTSDTAPTAESVRATGVGWADISARLARARGRVLVLLDACHSGGITQDMLVPNEELAGALARGGRAGAVVFAAAKGRQVSYEPAGARGFVFSPGAPAPKVVVPSGGEAHGFFTEALLHALSDGATDRDGDGAIEVAELVDEVTARVAKRSNGAQTPWVARRELIGDFAVTSAPHDE